MYVVVKCHSQYLETNTFLWTVHVVVAFLMIILVFRHLCICSLLNCALHGGVWMSVDFSIVWQSDWVSGVVGQAYHPLGHICTFIFHIPFLHVTYPHEALCDLSRNPPVKRNLSLSLSSRRQQGFVSVSCRVVVQKSASFGVGDRCTVFFWVTA